MERLSRKRLREIAANLYYIIDTAAPTEEDLNDALKEQGITKEEVAYIVSPIEDDE